MKDTFHFSQVIPLQRLDRLCFVVTPDCLFFSRADFSHPLFTQEIFTKFLVSGPGMHPRSTRMDMHSTAPALRERSFYFGSKDRQ